MRKETAILMFMVLISGVVFGWSKTKTMNISPNSSKGLNNKYPENMSVKVFTTSSVAGLGLGSGRIRIAVYNPKGRMIASGINRASFRTGKNEGKYKIVFTNKMKKRQKVKVSVITN